MADTNYIEGQTVITAETMQHLNNLFYRMLGTPSSAFDITEALPFNNIGTGLSADTLLEAVTESLRSLYYNGFMRAQANTWGLTTFSAAGSDPTAAGGSQDAALNMLNGSFQAVASLGYLGAGTTFSINAYQAGAPIHVVARTSAGADIPGVTIDPDVESALFHVPSGRPSYLTEAVGARIFADGNNNPASATGNTQQAKVTLTNANGDAAASLGYNADTTLTLVNHVWGGGVSVGALTDLGVAKSVLTANDTDPTTVYHSDGEPRGRTDADGLMARRSTGIWERVLTTSDGSGGVSDVVPHPDGSSISVSTLSTVKRLSLINDQDAPDAASYYGTTLNSSTKVWRRLDAIRPRRQTVGDAQVSISNSTTFIDVTSATVEALYIPSGETCAIRGYMVAQVHDTPRLKLRFSMTNNLTPIINVWCSSTGESGVCILPAGANTETNEVVFGAGVTPASEVLIEFSGVMNSNPYSGNQIKVQAAQSVSDATAVSISRCWFCIEDWKGIDANGV